MNRSTTTLALTDGQRLAVDQLHQIVGVSDKSIHVTHLAPSKDWAGYLEARITLDCSNLRRTADGLRLRSQEPVTLLVPGDFPFTYPRVRTRHTRFAGAPHVNWARNLCLYRSPATEWDPADGMYGFITRLLDWFEAAAAGQLDAPGEPLHPPTTATDHTAGLLVVRATAPTAPSPDEPWLGAALLHRVNDERSDVVGWLRLLDPWPDTVEQARCEAGLPDGADVFLAPALVTTRHLTFEYPRTARDLVAALARDHITTDLLLGLIGFVASHNRRMLPPADTAPTEQDEDNETPVAPVHLLLGTPSRGIAGDGQRQTHVVAWHLPDFADRLARLALNVFKKDQELAEIGERVMEIGERWLDGLSIRWMRIYEARPEVTIRRDQATPAAWLKAKKVLILGAGALGAPIAENCARAGAAQVTVVDYASVHPGILARQPYTDADIGLNKARVLADRLNGIDPHHTRVEAVIDDIIGQLPGTLNVHSFDLIVDCTANRTVRAYLEHARRSDPTPWPHLATLMVGHQATRGLAALSPRGTSGGGTDVLRRTALTAHADSTGAFADIIDDFFPIQPRTELFQPEPGCSDVTFTGSAADVTGLAGQLLTGLLAAVAAPDDQHTMATLVVRMPTDPAGSKPAGSRWLTWLNDTVITDEATGYDVRLTLAALAEMRAEARRGARVRGRHVETGGMLLGAVDDASGVIFVDEAVGPPPDSLLTEAYFQHGLTGVSGHLVARRTATGGISRFLGMWHTHPHTLARPSATDRAAMTRLTLPLEDAPSRALVLIAGGPTDTWHNWLTSASTPDFYAHLATRTAPADTEPLVLVSLLDLGSTVWPGGYTTRPHATHPSIPTAREARP
ncbi:ThiF family adenylyltransferase [Streptomyces sp. MMS21 TC-5]|uniref:ThiF family adenylyltransferase n=1 Tax=Streptomyces sp. MMS21 TC-5 TaxID=2925833 RepID=UPI001F60D5C5|nr:ThiF family adenylyltransferase [Streptomyces sp. MMS21 TC-5]MCI4085651.1 ThiF family adenylyltransferase [Streptomyces sp. MMS21 TC-5]